jgi:hypothetical protein
MQRSCAVLFCFLISCASAFPQDQDQLSPGKSFINERLSVVSNGLAVALCNTFDDNMFAVKRPVLTIRIENNVATYNRNPTDAMFSSCTGTVTEPLRVGEVVEVTDVSEHGHELRLRILSAPHAIQRGIGAYEHTVYEAGAAELRFKLNDMKDAPTAVRAWLQRTSQLPGNTASGVQVPKISEGMTPVQVESMLGAPDLKFDANGLTIYRYSKIGVGVTFKDGRVTQINASELSSQPVVPSRPPTAATANPVLLEGIEANSKATESLPPPQRDIPAAILKKDGTNERLKFGVTMGKTNETAAKLLGMKEPKGMVVISVVDQSVAFKAGILQGDAILKFGDTPINDLQDVIVAIAATPPGNTVLVTIWRAGKGELLMKAQF